MARSGRRAVSRAWGPSQVVRRDRRDPGHAAGGTTLTFTADVHGLRLELSAPAELERELAARLRYFPATPTADLVFEYRVGDRPVLPPAGAGRPVYDPVAGEALYDDDTDQLTVRVAGVEALCEPSLGRTCVSISEEARTELWLLSRPFFTLPLVELAKRRRRYSVHAACLGAGGRSVLLAGPRGSGKSTLALALARAGFDYVSDDLVFLEPDGDGVRALGFPEAVDVTEETARLFPELERLTRTPRRPGWPKHEVDVAETFGGRVVLSCQPAAIVFPQFSGTDTGALNRIPASEALLELAPNVLLTEPRSSQGHLDVLARLVGQAACFRLTTGRDLSVVAALVRTLV